MAEIDRMLGQLRLLIAELAAHEEQQKSLRVYARQQLQRLQVQLSRRQVDIESGLALWEEIEGRIEKVERTLQRLAILRQRAQDELDALELTKQVSQAQAELAQLTETPPEEGSAAERQAEIERLKQIILEASQQAADRIARRRPPEAPGDARTSRST